MSRDITQTPAWSRLRDARDRLSTTHLRELFANDPERFPLFSRQTDGLLLDFSKQRLDQEVLQHLVSLAEAADVSGWRKRLFAGTKSMSAKNVPYCIQHCAISLTPHFHPKSLMSCRKCARCGSRWLPSSSNCAAATGRVTPATPSVMSLISVLAVRISDRRCVPAPCRLSRTPVCTCITFPI